MDYKCKRTLVNEIRLDAKIKSDLFACIVYPERADGSTINYLLKVYEKKPSKPVSKVKVNSNKGFYLGYIFNVRKILVPNSKMSSKKLLFFAHT